MELVREHMSQHELAESEPLITESARITDVTPLDDERSDEVCREVATVLQRHGQEDLVDTGDPPEIDWDTLETRLEEERVSAVEKLRYLFERYHRDYPSLLTVEFEPGEEEIDFAPGQYVTIHFHDTPRPYSIASSPTQDRIQLCIRRVPGGELTPDLFEHLDPGDEITVRGPYGEFVLEEPSGRDMAFLATGTGVAPLKSMIDFTIEEGRDSYDGHPRDVWLFLGTSWKDDLAYHDHFRDLAATHSNFHYVPTLSRETYLSDWSGETAYVQHTVLKYLDDKSTVDVDEEIQTSLETAPQTEIGARIDPSHLEVYACGLNAMVETLVETMRQIGVSENHIQGEGYG